VLLYQAYRCRREEKKAVPQGWLRRQSIILFKTAYLDKDPDDFIFLRGWFTGFLSRHSISLRFTTNKSQKVPEEYLAGILQWMQFNRRNSQIRSQEEERVVGRYLLDSICNMDETPLPFEYLDGQTYADKGSHTVQVKATGSGWDKRQATLVLCIFRSGKNRLRPLIIFKGKENYSGTRRKYYQPKRIDEMSQYDTRVIVHWNETAYANADLLIEWITDYLVPVLPSGPRLLALDVAKFHCTDSVLQTLREHDITPSIIPAGCTGLVQPLDVSVNKPFKDLLRDLIDQALENYQTNHSVNLREIRRADHNGVAQRRILITKCVSEAWETFSLKYQELIVSTFRKLGLTLPIDGSCDEELAVKGISSNLLKIGSWERLYCEGSGLESQECSHLFVESGASGEALLIENEEDEMAIEFIDN